MSSSEKFWAENHAPPLRIDSRATARTYKPRTDKSRLKEEIAVMVLGEDGSSDMYNMTRPEILDLSKEEARRLRTLPFGEMKMKDLRMLDPNMSFGSEPKIIVRTLCALISMNPIHAFIMPSRVLLIVPDGADGILQSIKTNLKNILQIEMDQGSLSLSSDKYDAEPLELHPDDGEGNSDKASISKPDKSNVDRVSPSPTSRASGGTIPETVSISGQANVGPEWPAIEPPRSGTTGDDGDQLIHDSNAAEANSPHVMRSFHSPRGGSMDDGTLQLRLEKRTLLRTRSYDSRDETPFQFVALELLFDTAAISFKKDIDYLKLLRDSLHSNIAANVLLTKVNALRSRLIATRDSVEDFMSDDKDLGLFSFNSIIRYYSDTDPSSDASTDAWQPYEMDVNEVEDLAEDFVSRLDDAVNEMDMLKFTIEEIISNLRHQYDVRRERLMKLHVRIQGVTCLAAIPTVVAGIFGMNLYSGLEDELFNFWITFALLIGFFVISTFLFIAFSDRLLVGGAHPDD